MSFPELTTARTRLIELTEDCIPDLFAIFSDDRITEFMDIESMKSVEETRTEWVVWARDIYHKKTGIRWGIELIDHIVGTCGFHNIHNKNGQRIAEIGFDLKVENWGQGLIAEVTPAIIDHAFSVMGVDEIHAMVFPDNRRSKRVLAKMGFTYKKTNKLDEPCKNRFHEEDLFVLGAQRNEQTYHNHS